MTKCRQHVAQPKGHEACTVHPGERGSTNSRRKSAVVRATEDQEEESSTNPENAKTRSPSKRPNDRSTQSLHPSGAKLRGELTPVRGGESSNLSLWWLGRAPCRPAPYTESFLRRSLCDPVREEVDDLHR